MLAPSPFDEKVRAANTGGASIGLVALSFFLAALIFAVDVLVPLGVAGAAPYAGVVLIGMWSRWRPHIFVFAGLGTVLTILGHFYSPESDDLWVVIADHGLAILIICAAAIFTIEHQRGEGRLRAEVARTRSILNTLIDGVITIDLRGTVTSLNPAAITMFGYTPEEVVGNNVKMLMTEADHSQHDGYLAQYLKTGKAHIIGSGREVVGRRKDGSTFPLDLGVSEASIGGKAGYTGILREITERKRTEDALRHSESQLRLLADSLPVMIMSLDSNLRFRFANKAYCEIHSQTQADILGLDFREVIGETGYRILKPNLDAVLDGQTIEFETTYTFVDGIKRDIVANYVPEIDEHSAVRGLFVMLVDVTERKKIEDRMLLHSQVIEQTHDSVVATDRTGHVSVWNKGAEQMFGYDEKEALGKHISFIYPEDQQEFLKNEVIAPTEREGWHEAEVRMRRKSGEEFFAHLSDSVLKNAAGEPIGRIGLSSDITERKRTEEALRRSEASLANAQRIAHIGNWDWEIVAGNLHWSDEIYNIFGLEPQVFGATYEAFLATIHPDDRTMLEEAVNAALDGHAPYSIDHRIVLPSGEIRIVHEQAEVERDADGKPVTMRGTVQDITERRRAEVAQRESEARFRELAEGSMQGLLVIDADARPLFANRTAATIFGYDSPDDLFALPSLNDLIDPEERDRMPLRRKRLLTTGGSPKREDVKGLHKDGSTVWIEDMRRRIEWDGQPAIQITFADITERKRAEAALKESEARLDAFFTNAPVGLVLWDDQQRYLKVNDVAADWHGVTPEDHVGRAMAEIFPAYEKTGKASFQHIMETGKPVLNQEFVSALRARPDDEMTWLVSRFPIPGATGMPVGVGSIIIDITEQKRAREEISELNTELEHRVEKRTTQLRMAQSELVRKERLATLGQLSATVSHELRNPLGTIRNSLVVLENKLGGENPDIIRSVDRMVRNIGRCNNIIDEMLDFARARELELKKTAIDAWLDSVLDELQVPPGVSVGRKLGAPKAHPRIDDDRMRRVIVNVYDNACQAMIEEPKGKGPTKKKTLTISTKATKGRLEVAIADTGPGMPPEVFAAAFEPLYSTKGFGVGLGLPIVKQIMEQHGGGIDITSKHGSGTRVVLWLPLGQGTRKTKKGEN